MIRKGNGLDALRCELSFDYCSLLMEMWHKALAILSIRILWWDWAVYVHATEKLKNITRKVRRERYVYFVVMGKSLICDLVNQELTSRVSGWAAMGGTSWLLLGGYLESRPPRDTTRHDIFQIN